MQEKSYNINGYMFFDNEIIGCNLFKIGKTRDDRVLITTEETNILSVVVRDGSSVNIMNFYDKESAHTEFIVRSGLCNFNSLEPFENKYTHIFLDCGFSVDSVRDMLDRQHLMINFLNKHFEYCESDLNEIYHSIGQRKILPKLETPESLSKEISEREQFINISKSLKSCLDKLEEIKKRL